MSASTQQCATTGGNRAYHAVEQERSCQPQAASKRTAGAKEGAKQETERKTPNRKRIKERRALDFGLAHDEGVRGEPLHRRLVRQALRNSGSAVSQIAEHRRSNEGESRSCGNRNAAPHGKKSSDTNGPHSSHSQSATKHSQGQTTVTGQSGEPWARGARSRWPPTRRDGRAACSTSRHTTAKQVSRRSSGNVRTARSREANNGVTNNAKRN